MKLISGVLRTHGPCRMGSRALVSLQNRRFYSQPPEIDKYSRRFTLYYSRNISANAFHTINPSKMQIRSISIFKGRDAEKEKIPPSPFRDDSIASSNLECVGSSLIPAMNKLQEIFAMTGTTLDLPQIVVIGGQSSGKSSVLESLVGKDFLPRGTGIVTRRPLILQLTRIDDDRKEWAEFLHLPDRKFIDFERVRAEIQRVTDQVAGSNKGISAEPILLRVFSSRVMPLTLVDTPGMARNAVGDQPKNIEDQIRNLIREYIFQPNTVILAVHPANQDLATSDSIQMAKSADPDGQRTIGVLTKIDLMDKGTDVMPILLGRQFPLRREWTAVVNRGQSAIAARQSVEEAVKRESSFFQNHPAYCTIADRCGTSFLGKSCNKILSEHIRKALPDLRKAVNAMIKQRQEEILIFGAPLEKNDSISQGWQLLQLLNSFTNHFRESVFGNSFALSERKDSSELNGGAKIRYIFNDTFARSLTDVYERESLGAAEIRTAIINAAGSKPSLFVPDAAFETLVRRQIQWLREPSLQAAESVFNELLRIVAEVETKDLMRFYKLKDKIIELASENLRKHLKKTNEMINMYVDMELGYINTNHPDFVGLDLILNGMENLEEHRKSPPKKPTPSPTHNASSESDAGFFSYVFGRNDKKRMENSKRDYSFSGTQHSKPTIELSKPRGFSSNLTPREGAQVKIMNTLLDSYFNIVRKNTHDNVTKLIMMCLVKSFTENLNELLVSSLYKGNANYDDLLKEAGDVAMKRKVCLNELEALKKAKSVIQVSELMDL